MALLEKLGEKTITYSNKILYYLLGVLISIIEAFRKASKRLQGLFSPYPLLKKIGVELKDYIVLRTQILALAFLILTVLYIFDIFKGIVFLIIATIVAVSTAYSVTSLREHFQEDYVAYRDFFFSYMGISLVLLSVKMVKPMLDFPVPYAHFVVIALGYIFLFSFFFRARYARDYTFGRVIKGGDPMKVKVNYDIAASIKPGVHIFKNDVKAREGDLLKLSVSRGFMNIRGSRVIGVLEVMKK
jgi:uncharacterized membrane protein